MKRITKIFIAALLIVIMTSSMGLSTQAKTYYISGRTVEISADGYSETFSVYSTKAEADANPITFYAGKYSFPVDVVISSYDGFKTEYRFDSYGIKNVKDQYSALFNSTYWVYATIDIQPYPPISNDDTAAKAPTEDEIIDGKVKQLFDELDLGFCYVEYTPYYKELRAFLTGEWDGTSIEDHDTNTSYGGHIASRLVFRRNYVWNGINLFNGQVTYKEVNVDYIGYLEVVCPVENTQEFSFAISRTNRTLEQWSLLDKVDSWTLPKDAGTIDQICIVGENSGDPDECQAIVFTLDTEEQSHMYLLYPGGIIDKAY